MSIPVILASALLEMIGIATGDGIGSVNWFFVAIGMCAAFASGLGAIKLMLALVRRVDYKWFALYLVVLSVVLCVLQFAL